MEKLQSGNVLVLDRGYFSYLILIKAIEKGIHLNEFAAVYHGRWGDLRNVTRFQKNLLMLKTFIASLSAG